ncbi:MAG: hypothetical protein JWN30_1610 [Bacilli bacterium]|nr:hypothetical protein [Bacilli bacterium]
MADLIAWLLSFANVVVVNVILSGDNSLVISLAARRLPQQLQKKAIVWGSVLAIVLLMALVTAGSYLIRIPMIKIIAAVLLLWISVRLLIDHINHKELQTNSEHGSGTHATLPQAIRIIAVADLVMSLDNAVAMLGVADGNLTLLWSGLIVSIPLLIWGSHLFSLVLQKYSWLIYAAAALIAWLAGRMISEDPIITLAAIQEWVAWVAPVVCILILGGAWLWTFYKKVLNSAL